MKLIFFTDPHITDKTPASRTDNYPEALLKKFQNLCADINKHDPDYVICGGDWTDKPRISVELAGAFNREVKATNKPWYCVPGSHDTVGYNYDALNNTMLGYACRSGVMTLLDRDIGTAIDDGSIYIEGCRHYPDMDMLKENIHIDYGMKEYDLSKFNILVVHGMLLPSSAFPFVSCTDPNLEKKKKDAKNKSKSIVYCTSIDDILNDAKIYKPDLILSGHYHDGFEVKKMHRASGNHSVFLNPGSFGRNSICSRNVNYYVVDIKNGALTYQLEEIKCAQPYKTIFDFNTNKANAQTAAALKGYSKKLSQNISNARDLNDIINDIAKEDNLEDGVKQQAKKYVEDAKLTQIADSNDLAFKGYKEEQANIAIQRVIIKNFQSYQDQTIEFEDGLNVIVGASHKGKTAIVRALDWVFEDSPKGAGFIRAGAKSCSVEVEYTNGVRVKRMRTLSNTGKYIVREADGTETEFEKFKEMPINVLNASQVPAISFTKNYTVTPNVALQHDPPFFIGASGYDRAAVLGHLIDIDAVDLAIREIRKSFMSKNKDIKSKRLDLETTIEHLKQYAGLGGYRREILEYKDLYAAIKKNNDQLTELQGLYEKLSSAYKVLKEKKEYLDNLIDTDQATGLINKISKNIQAQGQLEFLFDGLKDSKNKLSDLNKKEFPVIDLNALIQKIETNMVLFKNLSAENNKLTGLYSGLKLLKNNLVNITEQQEGYQRDYDKVFDLLEVCPLCNRAM